MINVEDNDEKHVSQFEEDINNLNKTSDCIKESTISNFKPNQSNKEILNSLINKNAALNIKSISTDNEESCQVKDDESEINTRKTTTRHNLKIDDNTNLTLCKNNNLKPVTSNRIEKYKIIKTLGEGSFSQVKLAQDVTTSKKVALKIINYQTITKLDMQGRVEREISYLTMLKHPHIIRLHDVIKSKNELIMVIEYAGKELFDYIVEKGKLDEDKARRFFQQIIGAVECCHRHKVVHRDLKPENLLLDEGLNVKIADFGLSNIMKDGNFLKTSCGSPNYAAPEVISGKLYAGPEVDVWSSGVILYVMICGKLPFDDDFIPSLFTKISNGVFELPTYLSSSVKNLLKRILVVNPLNRITIREILDDEWFKQDIPNYLLPPDFSHVNDKKIEYDKDIIMALNMKMGYETSDIIDVIENFNVHNSFSQQSNEILDSYFLMKNNPTLVKELTLKANKKNINLSHPSVPSYTINPTSLEPGIQKSLTYQTLSSLNNLSLFSTSTVSILPSSLPSIHRAYMMETNTQTKLGTTVKKKQKKKWHIGIRSKSYPLDVMGEIYRALKNLGAEWTKPKEKNLWTIKVRWKYDTNKSNNTPNLLKMQIQLFQLKPDNYIVDFKFDGWESLISKNNEIHNQNFDEISAFSAYPFLHMTARLINELASNSQNS